MGKLVLVRHSEPDVRTGIPASEWGLTLTGRQLAEDLATGLRRSMPKGICSSKELKAVETADIIGSTLAVPVRVRQGLEEHHRDGVPHFSTRSEFEQSVLQVMLHPDRLMMGSETGKQALDRFTKALNDQLRSRSGDVIAVTHGTIMALYCGEVLGFDATKVWQRLSMPCFIVLEPDERRSPGQRTGGTAREDRIHSVSMSAVGSRGSSDGLAIYQVDTR